jgi:hypothetical protein
MITINFPEPEFRIKEESGVEYIFDSIRRQWLVLSGEEWVRQNFVHFLVKNIKYPAAMIALEKEIMLGELKKRFDILVYDDNHKPWMMIECKASTIHLNEEVLQQLLRYHISVPVTFLIITNGLYTYGWKKEDNQLKLIESIPEWK